VRAAIIRHCRPLQNRHCRDGGHLRPPLTHATSPRDPGGAPFHGCLYSMAPRAARPSSRCGRFPPRTDTFGTSPKALPHQNSGQATDSGPALSSEARPTRWHSDSKPGLGEVTRRGCFLQEWVPRARRACFVRPTPWWPSHRSGSACPEVAPAAPSSLESRSAFRRNAPHTGARKYTWRVGAPVCHTARVSHQIRSRSRAYVRF